MAIEHYEKAFQERPEGGYFGFGMNDGGVWCQCENCTKLDIPGLLTNSGYADYADRYYTYVNQVAGALRKKYPNHYLGVYAYLNVETPPRRIDRLEPNVYVYVTQDTAQHHDPAYGRGDHDVIAGWTRKTDLLFKFEYYGLGWVPPRYFPHLISEDLKFCKQAGLKGIYSELYPAWGSVLLAPYVAAHVWRDADSDVDALVDHACQDLFGPAAGEMKEYLELQERVIGKTRKGQWFEGCGPISQQVRIYEPQDVDEADRLLAEAVEKAETDLQRDRIEFIARWWRYAALHIKAYHLAQELHKAEVKSPSDATSLRSTLALLKETEEQRRQYHERYIENDPLVNAVWYRKSRKVHYSWRYAGWEGEMKQAEAAAKAKLGAWQDQRHR